ncbi:MAG: hypothetical protein GF399_03200 [Candidatus Coatesbacteria bacterium]|nr:hypothetical protein [Candidatus Coatesbacteria bacterium]
MGRLEDKLAKWRRQTEDLDKGSLAQERSWADWRINWQNGGAEAEDL